MMQTKFVRWVITSQFWCHLLFQSQDQNVRLATKMETLTDKVSSLQHENLSLRQQVEEARVRDLGRDQGDAGDKLTTMISSLRSDHEKVRSSSFFCSRTKFLPHIVLLEQVNIYPAIWWYTVVHHVCVYVSVMLTSMSNVVDVDVTCVYEYLYVTSRLAAYWRRRTVCSRNR